MSSRLRYLDHAQGYYRKHGKPTDEFDNIRYSLRPLKQLYGRTLVSEFKPRSLKAVRQVMNVIPEVPALGDVAFLSSGSHRNGPFQKLRDHAGIVAKLNPEPDEEGL